VKDIIGGVRLKKNMNFLGYVFKEEKKNADSTKVGRFLINYLILILLYNITGINLMWYL
jgi:hypothetical protein